MVNLTLFYTLVIILTIAYLLLGYYASHRTTNEGEFFLAGRNLNMLPITFSLVATQLGGGAILGVSELSYKYGLTGIYYTLGLSLGMICVSFFAAGQMRLKEISTIAELFEKEYNSKFLRKIASIFSIVSLLGIFIAIVISSRKFLYGIGIDSKILIYGFWISLAIYTIIGGIKAVVYTDILQLSIIFIFFIITLIYLSFTNAEYITFSFEHLLDYKLTDKPSIDFSSLILIPFLFVFIEQDMAQKFFSAKNARVAKTSSFIAGLILLLFSFIPVILGVAARKFGNIPEGASVMMYSLTQVSNQVILALVSIAILSAIISTGDSLLCAVTSNVMLDFDLANLSTNQLKITRIITALLSVISIFIAEFFDEILGVMLYSYEIMICVLFGPYIICYFSKIEKNKFSCFVSIIAGACAYLFYIEYINIIPRCIFCIIISFFAYMISQIFIIRPKRLLK